MYKVAHRFSLNFFVCVVMLAAPLWLFAQAKNVTVTVYRVEDLTKRDARKPWNNQIVYGFFSAGKANKFYENCMKAKERGITYVPAREDEYDVMEGTGTEGDCTLLLPLTGYIIVKPEGAEVKKEAVKNRLNIEINIVEGKVIQTVRVLVKRPPGPEPQIPDACGNRLEFFYQFPLSPEQVDVKSRIIVKPLVTVLETGDTLGCLSPFVKDGTEFAKANYRRVGFDYSNDPLYRYHVGFMRESHARDSMPMHVVLYPVNRNLHYRITADMVYGMNMKTPYRIDSICLSEGYVRDPMRFLDYDMIQVPIDKRIYERRGRAQLSKDHSKLYLNFLQGKAELDPADSTNMMQLNQLKQTLSRYDGADAGIMGAVIHGSASPEGGVAVNERLCRQRADFLKQELNGLPCMKEARDAGEVKSAAKVASWERVAEELAADSLGSEAQMVRSILQYTRDVRKQEEQIRHLPCWEVIEKRILPRLRYVDIEYSYYTNRVKTREEIWKEYQENPDYHAGKLQKPYEFYHLLDMIKDPAEKEPIARAAYESVKEGDGVRPWALAAYELAQCYLARNHTDTMLLKPYLDEENRRFYEKTDFDTDSKLGWYNDPAIVTTHIDMLCKKGDFAKAYVCAKKLLPEEPRFKKLEMFLRCLNCEWDDPEVIDTVSNSSHWNKIVILAAQSDISNKETALFMLTESSKVNQADPRVLYMKAQLLFSLFGKSQKSTVGYRDENFIPDEFFEPASDDPYRDEFGETVRDWGVPMVQCALTDEDFIKVMLFDGEFNDDYRKAFKAYWKKIKDGTAKPPKLPEQTAQTGQQATDMQEPDLLDEMFGEEE